MANGNKRSSASSKLGLRGPPTVGWERRARIERFWNGDRGFLIVQRPTYHLWGECNSVEGVWGNNLRHLDSWLRMPWSDELPHLQAWFGTGVYANAFGCEYLWREEEAPDSHVLYRSIEQVRGLPYPDYRRSPIMRMALDAIDALKEEFRGRFPIALTDTQSPVDTATLVLDATEFFVACYTHEAVVRELLETIKLPQNLTHLCLNWRNMPTATG